MGGALEERAPLWSRLDVTSLSVTKWDEIPDPERKQRLLIAGDHRRPNCETQVVRAPCLDAKSVLTDSHVKCENSTFLLGMKPKYSHCW